MPRHILVVEDEPAIREMLADVLDDEGYSVATAASVEAALVQIRVRRPQLIICDLVLPPSNGREIYERLAWQPAGASGSAPPIPIVFITALPPLVADEQLIGDIQHVPVLYKPIIIGELLTVVSMFIANGS